MKRVPCIAGRATTCWKAYPKEDPQTPLVIQDSWQYPELEEEGELLGEATEPGIINVARYYHHETVQVGGIDDDIRSNVRKNLDITLAENHRAGRSATLRCRSTATPRKGRSTASIKRSSSQTGAFLPPSKDPVPFLRQRRLVALCGIEYTGGLCFVILGSRFTSQALK